MVSIVPNGSHTLPVDRLLAQETNILTVRGVTEKAGVRISRFLSDIDLELYFDIESEQSSACYVSKGWTDPGFRVAALISMPRRMYVPDDSHSLLANTCALQGVAICRNLNMEGEDWTVESVLYSGGFNAETFRHSIDAVRACERYLNQFLASHLFTSKQTITPT
jgi:hypothetical protein